MPVTKVFSNSFSEVTGKDLAWCDGMVTGNGVQGAVIACAPYSDTIIYQNIHFILPSDQPRHIPPEVSGELEEARQAVVQGDDDWDVHGRSRTYDYCFHPGHQLRLDFPHRECRDYVRWTDFETAEVCVRYTDEDGVWERRTFASRTDDVVITRITRNGGVTAGGSGQFMGIRNPFADGSLRIPTRLRLSIDDISALYGYGGGAEKELSVTVSVNEEANELMQYAVYPVYEESELNGGGYCGITHVICPGGMRMAEEDTIRIDGADEVILITKCDRSFDLKKDSVDQRLRAELAAVVEKYSLNGVFSYEASLEESRKIQSEMFRRVSFSLDGSESEQTVFNEELIAAQKESDSLLTPFVERVYAQGRYVMICCGGVTMSRLCGMWTGQWNCGWNGIYTMDANVNLQSSSMNTGNLKEFGIGYINFVLRQITDWKENAKAVYGMEDALLVPVNFDGDRAMMVEYDWMFPFQYWNAGASWMLQPIYEFYQCFGDMDIDTVYGKKNLLHDILLPLFTMQAGFWSQLVTPEYYTDASGNACYQKGKTKLEAGEKYLIVPSYSPENNPKGKKSRMTANASMDIAAAKDGLTMTIRIEQDAKTAGYQERIDCLKQLLSELPEYQYDETGAIREWAANGFEDNHEHRHISHLYPAWPAFETQGNAALVRACSQAIINRNIGNDGHDDVSSHGWLHKALVFARLKEEQNLYEMLYAIFHSDIFYRSLMADHNTTGNFVYCTDTTLGVLGIIHEALVYSDDETIELLPALPKQWKKGTIRGIMTRCGAEVKELSWDLDTGEARYCIASPKAITVTLRCMGRTLHETIRIAELFSDISNMI